MESWHKVALKIAGERRGGIVVSLGSLRFLLAGETGGFVMFAAGQLSITPDNLAMELVQLQPVLGPAQDNSIKQHMWTH